MPPEAALPVWVIEDDDAFRDVLAAVVGYTSGMRCGGAFASVEDALAWRGDPANGPRVILLDVNLPGMTGIEGLSALKARHPAARVVMLTIHDDAETIFSALRAGASGYLVKNAGVDQVVAAVREAAAGGMLMPAPVAREVLALFQQPANARDYGLTDRERDVLQEMVRGRTQKEIGEALFVSPHTVNTHVQHIYEKLHVHSSSAAVAKALRERLVPMRD